MRKVAAVVPAAGRGRRFGGPKLLASVEGVPLIQRTLDALLGGGVTDVVVVVSPTSPVRENEGTGIRALSDERVRMAVNPDPAPGMLSSIQKGLALVDGDPILILPGDMPFVRSLTVASVAAAAIEGGVIVSPRFDGQRGHPIAIPGRLRASILEAPPSSSLNEVIEPHKPDRLELDVDDPGILRDVDRVGDLD